MGKHFLEVHGLEVTYGKVKALQGISFSLDKGEIIALAGGSNTGKSSVLRAIAGLAGISSGKVKLAGKNITNLPPHLISSAGIAYIAEIRGGFTRFSVEENLLLAAYKRSDDDAVKKDLGRVYRLFPRLAGHKSAPLGRLKDGEKEMMAIGQAILSGARLLLLDEPFAAVDPIISGELFRGLHDANKVFGYTLLLAEQNTLPAFKLANRVYIMEEGSLILSGTARPIINREKTLRPCSG